MTSRLTVKKSTLSSGAPQAPAQITPTPTSCLPGKRLTIYNSHSIPYTAANHTGQLLMKSWLVVFTMSCVYVEPYRCVCEGHKPRCFLMRRNYVSGKISALLCYLNPCTRTQMCMHVYISQFLYCECPRCVMTSLHIWHNNYSAFTLIFSKFRV